MRTVPGQEKRKIATSASCASKAESGKSRKPPNYILLEKAGGSRRVFDLLPPGSGSKYTRYEATGRTPRRICVLGGGGGVMGKVHHSDVPYLEQGQYC